MSATINDAVFEAVSTFRNSPTLDDEQIYLALVARGFERKLAARLVEFLPAVYCRLILANSGAGFSDTLHRKLPDGTFQEQALSSDPVWSAAMAFAQTEIASGIAGNELLALAGRSAEFNAANQLLHQGSKLKDIRFTPMLFPWPEEGPDHRG